MSSLVDLCLNKIEESGADTRELSQMDVPSRMWTRHPIFKLEGRYYFASHGTETEQFETTINTDIEITYTGIYHLKCHIYVSEEYDEDQMKEVYNFLKIPGPYQYEKTYEDEVKPSAISVEILLLLLKEGRASYIDSYFDGKIKLTLPEWCVDEWEEPDCMLDQITERLKFISGYVNV